MITWCNIKYWKGSFCLANERDGLSLSITEQGVIGKILRHIAFKHADTPRRPREDLEAESNFLQNDVSPLRPPFSLILPAGRKRSRPAR